MFNWSNVSRYRLRLFYNFFFLFLAFAIVIGIFQYNREKSYRVTQLESTLKTYVDMVNNYILSHKADSVTDYYFIQDLEDVFSNNDLRITVISNKGEVYYDSSVDEFEEMDNHIKRPEIQQCLHKMTGKSIRKSATTDMAYYYYAVNYNNRIIRSALPYNIHVENYLKADTFFIYFILLIFIVFGVILMYFTDQFGKSLIALQKFANNAARGKAIDVTTSFPENELGYIGEQIVEVYNRLQKTQKALSTEREKLFRHLQISHEGFAVFTKDKKQLLANNHFIQYLNIISDETAIVPNRFFELADLQDINSFIDKAHERNNEQFTELVSEASTINKSGKYYVVQAIVFADRSFEISINDVTKIEKAKKLKQQMTSNIAHELKTPVSSILGYVETILSSEMPKEKMRFFLERTYFQTKRLSALIQDISLLNKIEETSDLFKTEKLEVKRTIDLVTDDLAARIEERGIELELDVLDNMQIKGNKSIFYSIWRNLVENTINYAGENVTITINNYHKDDNFLYFSYSDNGQGIPEEHFSRIFERFYRVDSGRSRSTGGTGLGLAIVKNGVQYHKGEISIKQPKNGGVEFVFSIARQI